MIELSAEFGYGEVSVARVCAQAGVSTASFYERFDSREECLLAACDEAVRRILGGVAPASDAGSPDALRLALGRVLDAFQLDADAGRVLLVEALAGGPRVQARRRRILAECERRAEALLDGSRSSVVFDIPAAALFGAVRFLVARRLRECREHELPTLAGELIDWVGAYAIAPGASRWSSGSATLLAPELADSGGQGVDACALSAPRLPRGRHRAPPRLAARIQRERVIHGTARATSASGYAEVSVAEIVAATGVSRQVFYEHFPNKHDAFIAAQHHATVNLLSLCWDAYFTVESWPERVWSVLEALTGLIAANPAHTHVRVVNCYAAGPAAVAWTEQLVSAATIFLREGYRSIPPGRELPALCSQAIAGAIFELVQRDVAEGRAGLVPRRLPLLAYLALAPFTGPGAASQLVAELSARRADDGGGVRA